MKKGIQIGIFLLFMCFFTAVEVSAAPVGSGDETGDCLFDRAEKDSGGSRKRAVKQYQIDQGKWKFGKKHIWYCDSTKKKVTGIVRIGKHKYCFDKKGFQQTGWCRFGNSYYYFCIRNGKKGYMMTNGKADGIPIDSSGKARPGSGALRKKVMIMAECSRLVNENTYELMQKKKKLGTMFKFLNKKFSYSSGGFHYSKDWEIDFAWRMIQTRSGTCHHFGVMFAFLANAVGYNTAYAVSSGGHGWAEVEGCVCDPTQALADKRHSYFLMPMNLSGVDHRPRYSQSRAYVKHI